jgi:hypothetical protein
MHDLCICYVDANMNMYTCQIPIRHSLDMRASIHAHNCRIRSRSKNLGIRFQNGSLHNTMDVCVCVCVSHTCVESRFKYLGIRFQNGSLHDEYVCHTRSRPYLLGANFRIFVCVYIYICIHTHNTCIRVHMSVDHFPPQRKEA